MALQGWDLLGDLASHGPARPPDPDTVGAVAVAQLAPPPPRPWRLTARAEQLAVAGSRAPFTFYLAGRGTGKTHTGSNTLVEWALAEPGYYAIVAPTFGDCQTLCVEGKSGILVALGTPSGAPNDLLERYDRSKYRLHLRNGSVLVMASDEAPARLRGPNYTGAWCDEPGSWRKIKETWDEGVLMSTRIGSARKLITGTPKRGNPLVREMHDRGVAGDPDVALVRGKTMDNAANLSGEFLRTVMAKYSGTALGAQELEGLLLSDAEGALMTTALIEATRVRPENVPELHRIMVGVDPAVTDRPESDHTGIVVVGIGGPPVGTYLGEPARVGGQHLYVLADESLRATPRGWAERVLKVAEQWAADAITPEVNMGGDLVTSMIQLVQESQSLPSFRLLPVRAAVDKRTRAEPVAGVFEQRRIHIVTDSTIVVPAPDGTLVQAGMRDLEDQLSGWVPGQAKSPDQLDAFVWACVGLMPELAITRGRATVVKVLN